MVKETVNGIERHQDLSARTVRERETAKVEIWVEPNGWSVFLIRKGKENIIIRKVR